MTFERLMRHVERKGDCLIWIGCRERNGYGKTHGGLAHRVAFELIKGAIGKGLELDHLCRNRACINPGHLEAVTHRENQRRAHAATGTGSAATHCKLGHPYDEHNTRHHTGDGKHARVCRACNAQAVRRYRARKDRR